jgi:hypothetical protein
MLLGILVKATIFYKNMTINLLLLIINKAEEKSVVLFQVQLSKLPATSKKPLIPTNMKLNLSEQL